MELMKFTYRVIASDDGMSESKASTTSPLVLQEQSPPSLTQRVVAAGIAACVSALVTNPLDVIKTRMQTTPYNINNISSGSMSGISNGSISSTATSRTATSSATTTATLKTKLNNNTSSCPPKCPTNAITGTVNCVSQTCTTYDGNFYQVTKKIIRREGMGALWRGTKTALIMAGPAVGVYLPCYDFIRDYSVEQGLVRDKDMAPLIAGAGARTIAVFAVAPLELLRTRQLAASYDSSGSSNSNSKNKSDSSSSGGSNINKSSSTTHVGRQRAMMFTGVSSTLIRDVPFSMMYWYVVEKLRTSFAGKFSSENQKIDSLACAFFSGNVAGSVISALTTPGDVLKTRIQVNNTNASIGMYSELQKLLKYEGASALFKGVLPRALRGGPTCGIVLVAYELIKNL